MEGESGSGKTTLLKILANIIKPDSGTVVFNNDENPFYLPTEGILFSNLNIKNNIKQILKINKSLKFDYEYFDNCIKYLGFAGFLEKKLYKMSGGERKILNLLFALSLNKNVILLDEPFAELDSERKNKLLQLINDASENKTFIIANHDLDYSNINSFQVLKLTDIKNENFVFEEVKYERKLNDKINLFNLSIFNLKTNKLFYSVFTALFLVISVLVSFICDLDFKSVKENNSFSIKNEVSEYLDISFRRNSENAIDDFASFSSQETRFDLFDQFGNEIRDFKVIFDIYSINANVKNSQFFSSFPLVILSDIDDNSIYTDIDETSMNIDDLFKNIDVEYKIEQNDGKYDIFSKKYFSPGIFKTPNLPRNGGQYIYIGDKLFKELLIKDNTNFLFDFSTSNTSQYKISKINFVDEKNIFAYSGVPENTPISINGLQYTTTRNGSYLNENELEMSWNYVFNLVAYRMDGELISVGKNEVGKVQNLIINSPFENSNSKIEEYKQTKIILICLVAVLTVILVIFIIAYPYKVIKNRSVQKSIKYLGAKQKNISSAAIFNVLCISILVIALTFAFTNMFVTMLNDSLYSSLRVYENKWFPIETNYDNVKSLNYFSWNYLNFLIPVLYIFVFAISICVSDKIGELYDKNK